MKEKNKGPLLPPTPIFPARVVLRPNSPPKPSSEGSSSSREVPGPRNTLAAVPVEKPQIAAWAEQINERIQKLDAWAARLGSKYGLASNAYDLAAPNRTVSLPAPEAEGAGPDLQHYHGDGSITQPSPEKLSLRAPETLLDVAAAFAAAMMEQMVPVEQVTLEQREGRWGIYFYRGPAAFGPSAATNVKPTTVPLKDAPLAVRERFLRHAEQFFRGYVAMAESRLAQVKESVAGGDAALTLLESLKLD